MSQEILDAGVYTPTLTNTTNLDGSTPTEFMYLRVGRMVHVSGRVDVDPTAAAGASTVLGVSFPIPSAIASVNDCVGVANSGIPETGIVFGDTVNGRATVSFLAQNAANHALRVQFTYKLID